MLKILKWTAALSMMRRIVLKSVLTSTIQHQKDNNMKRIDVGKVLKRIRKMALVAERKRILENNSHRKVLFLKNYPIGS